MRAKKSVSLLLVSALLAQTLAPLAYAQQQGGGGGGTQQPVDPIVVVPTDPGDVIVPDNYADLPIAHPGLTTTSSDQESEYGNGFFYKQASVTGASWTNVKVDGSDMDTNNIFRQGGFPNHTRHIKFVADNEWFNERDIWLSTAQ